MKPLHIVVAAVVVIVIALVLIPQQPVDDDNGTPPADNGSVDVQLNHPTDQQTITVFENLVSASIINCKDTEGVTEPAWVEDYTDTNPETGDLIPAKKLTYICDDLKIMAKFYYARSNPGSKIIYDKMKQDFDDWGYEVTALESSCQESFSYFFLPLYEFPYNKELLTEACGLKNNYITCLSDHVDSNYSLDDLTVILNSFC